MQIRLIFIVCGPHEKSRTMKSSRRRIKLKEPPVVRVRHNFYKHPNLDSDIEVKRNRIVYTRIPAPIFPTLYSHPYFVRKLHGAGQCYGPNGVLLLYQSFHTFNILTMAMSLTVPRSFFLCNGIQSRRSCSWMNSKSSIWYDLLISLAISRTSVELPTYRETSLWATAECIHP